MSGLEHFRRYLINGPAVEPPIDTSYPGHVAFVDDTATPDAHHASQSFSFVFGRAMTGRVATQIQR